MELLNNKQFHYRSPLAHEFDYSLINYEPPDFWLRQKEKLKKREH
jgi:hypothetical protein